MRSARSPMPALGSEYHDLTRVPPSDRSAGRMRFLERTDCWCIVRRTRAGDADLGELSRFSWRSVESSSSRRVPELSARSNGSSSCSRSSCWSDLDVIRVVELAESNFDLGQRQRRRSPDRARLGTL